MAWAFVARCLPASRPAAQRRPPQRQCRELRRRPGPWRPIEHPGVPKTPPRPIPRLSSAPRRPKPLLVELSNQGPGRFRESSLPLRCQALTFGGFPVHVWGSPVAFSAGSSCARAPILPRWCWGPSAEDPSRPGRALRGALGSERPAEAGERAVPAHWEGGPHHRSREHQHRNAPRAPLAPARPRGRAGQGYPVAHRRPRTPDAHAPRSAVPAAHGPQPGGVCLSRLSLAFTVSKWRGSV